jgi:peptidoglycan biosynthesis protein MviN/MurJ (putative lipid II flippase)
VLIAALSTEHKFLLAGTAAIFIAFSLISSFVLPRRDPNFPGKDRNLFLGASVVLFVAMMLAVEFFAVEEEEPGAKHEARATLISG